MSLAVERENIVKADVPDLQSLLDLTAVFPVGTICAISEEQMAVVAFGDDLDKIYAEAKGKGEDKPLIWQVPDPRVHWAY